MLQPPDFNSGKNPRLQGPMPKIVAPVTPVKPAVIKSSQSTPVERIPAKKDFTNLPSADISDTASNAQTDETTRQGRQYGQLRTPDLTTRKTKRRKAKPLPITPLQRAQSDSTGDDDRGDDRRRKGQGDWKKPDDRKRDKNGNNNPPFPPGLPPILGPIIRPGNGDNQPVQPSPPGQPTIPGGPLWPRTDGPVSGPIPVPGGPIIPNPWPRAGNNQPIVIGPIRTSPVLPGPTRPRPGPQPGGETDNQPAPQFGVDLGDPDDSDDDNWLIKLLRLLGRLPFFIKAILASVITGLITAIVTNSPINNLPVTPVQPTPDFPPTPDPNETPVPTPTPTPLPTADPYPSLPKDLPNKQNILSTEYNGDGSISVTYLDGSEIEIYANGSWTWIKNTTTTVSAAPPSPASTPTTSSGTPDPFHQAITDKLNSSEPGDQLEGKIGQLLEKDLIGFDTPIDDPVTGKRVGQKDMETSKAIVETTIAKEGKRPQLIRLRDNKLINPNGKPVVLYAPNYSQAGVKALRAQGFYVAQTEAELQAILARL